MGPSKNGVVLNVEQFIKDVENRPAIWNRNYHCNKYFLEQTWQELCKIHKLPATVLKAKWKGLRDNFRVEFKRIPRNPDGQLAFPPEYYQSKWNHFLALQFLVDHMRQRGVKYENTTQNCDDTMNGTMSGGGGGGGGGLCGNGTLSGADDEECIVEPDIHDVLVSNCIDGSDDNPDDLETQISNYKRKQLELSNELNGIGNLSVNGSQHSSSSTLEFSMPTKKQKYHNSKIENNNDETLDLSTNKNSKNLLRDISSTLSTLNESHPHHHQHHHHQQQQHQHQQHHHQNSISDVLNLTNNHNHNNNLGNSSSSFGNGNTLTIARHDDDFYYLMSLHPFMQHLTPAKKLKIRTKIQKLILRELYKKADL